MGKKKRNDRARDQKRKKHQRRREEAKKEAKARALPRSPSGLVGVAAGGAFGPAWVSASYHDDPLALVTTVLTRRIRGRLLAVVTLVDRTCLGAKDAFVFGPTSEDEILEFISDELGARREDFVRCSSETVQSIVFQAIDYASTLGFEPCPAFPVAMFEPRPDPMPVTPRARPERPIYIAGPDDDVGSILRQLRAAVGEGNFGFVLPGAHELAEALDPDEPWDLDPEDRGGVPGRIDWEEAIEGVPWQDVLESADFDEDDFDTVQLHEAAQTLAWRLETGWFLVWEAALRAEQGLGLTAEQKVALAGLMGGDGGRILYIDDGERPCEPWYQSLRRLAPHLVAEGDEVRRTYDGDEATRKLVAAVEAHAPSLSLPARCTSIEDMLPGGLWHRLRIRDLLAQLEELDPRAEHGRGLMAPPYREETLRAVAEAVQAYVGDLVALEWTLDVLLARADLPVSFARELSQELSARSKSIPSVATVARRVEG